MEFKCENIQTPTFNVLNLNLFSVHISVLHCNETMPNLHTKFVSVHVLHSRVTFMETVFYFFRLQFIFFLSSESLYLQDEEFPSCVSLQNSPSDNIQIQII